MSPEIVPASWLRQQAGGRHDRQGAVGAGGHVGAGGGKAGAATGDVDALCRRLRQAAADADRSLAMAGRATGPGHQPEPVCTQVTDLVLAAGAIQDVAALAVASMSGPAVRGLADDARREALALAAGIARASRGAAGGLPGEPA